MSEAIGRMVTDLRRELIAWAIAGAALHLAIKHGFTKWTLAAFGLSVTIGAAAARKRRKTNRPEE